jgi:hypothetical protein
MFEMDAYVGVDVLGLQFMKGDRPHAGFPEIRYHHFAEGLARAGYRVVVVEQVRKEWRGVDRGRCVSMFVCRCVCVYVCVCEGEKKRHGWRGEALRDCV